MKYLETDLLHILPFLVSGVRQQEEQNFATLSSLNIVVPSNRFFLKEELRYTSIFKHFYGCKALAAVREITQNSNDAGTSRLDVKALSINTLDSVTNDNLAYLQASASFVVFSDTGVWCPEDQYRTYDICTQFFLRMNGSSKDKRSDADGGFGVGRFVIIFCAPLWVFTARHLLVVGHFNCYKVLCRRCLSAISGPHCFHCHLHERDTPRGTTFMVNYKELADGTIGLSYYLDRAVRQYFRFCNTSFPIFVAGKQVTPMSPTSTIYRDHQGYFVCSKLGYPTSADNKQEEEEAKHAYYMVTTSAGVLMFSERVYGENSAPGFYRVAMDQNTSFTDFDQSRATLIGPRGTSFRNFLSIREGDHGNNDVDKDHRFWVQGASTQNLFGGSSSSSAAQSIIAFPSPSVSISPSSAPSSEAEIKDEHKVQGPVECFYFFRNGATMDNIDSKWRPGNSFDQVYMLVSWTVALQSALTAAGCKDRPFSCGFVFDDKTLAMKQGPTFYINPVEIDKSVGGLSKFTRHKTMGFLIARAAHEVSHLFHTNHNAGFASAMTDIMAQMTTTELSSGSLALGNKDSKIRQVSRKLLWDFRTSLEEKGRASKLRKINHTGKSAVLSPGDSTDSAPSAPKSTREIIDLVNNSDDEDCEENYEENYEDGDPSSDYDPREERSGRRGRGTKRRRS